MIVVVLHGQMRINGTTKSSLPCLYYTIPIYIVNVLFKMSELLDVVHSLPLHPLPFLGGRRWFSLKVFLGVEINN